MTVDLLLFVVDLDKNENSQIYSILLGSRSNYLSRHLVAILQTSFPHNLIARSNRTGTNQFHLLVDLWRFY